MNTHRQPAVADLLDALFRDAEQADLPTLQRIRALAPEARAALQADYKRMYASARDAYLPVSRETGELLYVLAVARDARHLVEFGTSFGISTIYLASALRDNGVGRLVTTELEASKAERARRHLASVALDGPVDFRVGDALETLAELPGPVDFVLLDGAKSLYLDILRMLEPRLAPRAVIVADNIDMTERVADYTAHVRDAARGYVSSRVGSLEVSVWTR